SIVFSPDGTRIATAHEDNTVLIHDNTGKNIGEPLDHEAPVLSVVFSADGKFILPLASASDDKIIHISDIRQLHSSNPIQYKLVGHTEAVTCIQYSPDGTRLISGSTDCTIRLWDTTTREIIATISTNSPVQCLVVSRSGHQIACGSNEGSIQVWDANTGEQSEVINCGDYEGSISAIVFAPDGRRLLSGSTDGEVHVWELL
ncbi:WD40-repeat-containing domain protein, partial [Rhodocollybia butyracea]